MRRLPLLPALFLTLSAVAGACRGNSGETPVPRRTAYPRIEPYPRLYDTIRTGSVTLPVNSAAALTVSDRSATSTWIDAVYPRYGATLRYTVTRLQGKALLDAIDGRLTRMSLNTGGNTTEITETRSPGGICSTVLVSPAATVTPVQILSTDSTTFMLSGVLEITRPDVTADEIAPVVEAVRGDVIHTASHIALP